MGLSPLLWPAGVVAPSPDPVPRWLKWAGGLGLALLILRALGKPAVIRGLLVSYPAYIPPGGNYKVRRKNGKIHKGVDIFAPEGTAVAAAAAGRVSWSGSITGYGETVVLDHPGGVRTLYAHLSRRDVGVGTEVAQGDLVGRVGRTADDPKCGRYFCDDPPHLHFEVITDAGPINPSRERTNPLAWLDDAGMAPYSTATAVA